MDRLSAMGVFVRIVETGSLSATARALGTTQPSISRQLRALEHQLQAQLLRRSTRHVSLTEAGRTYYEDCKRILSDVESAEAHLGSMRASLSGTIRINTSVALGVDFVAPVAFAFQRQHPDLAVDLTLNERFVNLVEEGIDLAIRFGPVRDESLVARRLGITRRLTLAAPSYLRRCGTPRKAEDLASHACIAFNYEPANEWSYRGPTGDVRVAPRTVLRSNNGHVIRDATVQGLGIGWLPEALVHPLIAAGKLRVLLRDYTAQPLEVHAVYSSARHVPLKVRAFVAFAVQQFGRFDGFVADEQVLPAPLDERAVGSCGS